VSRLTIRRRILIFQVMVGAAALLMAAAGYIAIVECGYHSTRKLISYRQLQAITELAARSHAYSEQIAKLLLVGERARPDLLQAEGAVQAGFLALEEATRRENDFLVRQGESAAGQDVEFERIQEMRRLFAQLSALVPELSALREAGQQDQAVRTFLRGVDDSLEAQLESLIAVGAADESREVSDIDRRADQLARRSAIFLGLTACLSLLAALGVGYFLSHSIVRRVDQLGAAAGAFDNDRLSVGVGPAAKDELGILAARVDDMATQLRRQPALLLEAKRDLEAEVQSRTAELEKANERLRNVDRSRLQFMAEISHELRTPLTVLRGEAEVALRSKESSLESYGECLRGVVEQAREMSALVDDLLFLARSETDEIRFRNELLDLREVSAEAAREANILARARHVRVDFSMSEDALIVDGDPQRIKQLLLILLDNGIKYSTQNGVVCLHLEKDSRHASISVRNIGVGIRSEELPRIFEPFYRGANAAATTSRGSGLGLSIAKWIVGRHGGTIALSKSADDVVQLAVRFPLALASIGDNDMTGPPPDFAEIA